MLPLPPLLPPNDSPNDAQPARQEAVVPGPARDTFLYYRVGASSSDVNPLWAHARFCLSNLVWVNDHFVVTPNPLYLEAGAADLEGRCVRVLDVLRRFYHLPALLAEDAPVVPLGLRNAKPQTRHLLHYADPAPPAEHPSAAQPVD